MSKTALITGITGQDGAYLAELLLHKGYKVHGLTRRTSLSNSARLTYLFKDNIHEITMHYGDMSDALSLVRILNLVKPDEIYNLAAQSHVQVSFENPEYTGDINALGALRILEAMRMTGIDQTARFYQASTSEVFGAVKETPQTERTPFHPRSPYGTAKVYAYHTVVNYREAYGMHASNGVLFNHESPLRGAEFVSRKITKAVAAIHNGTQDYITLGNLEAKRDWGHARDYVEGMWQMTQQDTPDDYILASGQTHSVRTFVEAAFACCGINIRWDGNGRDEKGYDAKSAAVRVVIDPAFMRPSEVDLLLGDSSKARDKLGWSPKTGFDDLIREMVDADIRGEFCY